MAKKKQVEDQIEEDTEVEETVEAPKKGKPKGRVFTYVGGGEDSPRVINFMGLQKFVRGQATEVTNAQVLAKISGGTHPTFIEGEVEQEELHNYDEKAREEAEEQRKKDAKTNAEYFKKHKTE